MVREYGKILELTPLGVPNADEKLQLPPNRANYIPYFTHTYQKFRDGEAKRSATPRARVYDRD